MDNGWQEKQIDSIDQAIHLLSKLRIHKNSWLYRGTSNKYNKTLIPSIDRQPFCNMPRYIKISLERESIETFRSTYKLISTSEERVLFHEDITTLMLMQHYGAPTRLLDWSLSPYIAAYFAVCEHDKDDGLIWGFDYNQYIKMGDKQWKKYPEMLEGGFQRLLLPAFQEKYEHKWFVCQFLYQFNFPRILAQDGLFTFSSQFDQDHAIAIKDLLQEPNCYKLFRIKHNIKSELRKFLRSNYNIWHGSLFPDSFGAATAVRELMQDRL